MLSLELALLLHLATVDRPGLGSKLLEGLRHLTRDLLRELPFEAGEPISVATLAELAPEAVASRLTSKALIAQQRQMLDWAEQEHCGIVCLGDPDYPELLAAIHDPPVCLFVRGDVSLLNQVQLAVVGTRKPTIQGLKATEQLVEPLAAAGVIVTSGLAYGIDAMAHRAAIKSGRSIAVMGSGIDYIYPRGNERLARQLEENGAIVSEFPIGTDVWPGNFPQRNRIVTGMSRGTLVIEAALKSGSLVSARLALEQGREVYALPGSIYNRQSEGCLQLIEQGAVLVRNVASISGDFPECLLEEAQGVRLTTDQTAVLEMIGAEPVPLDDLLAKTTLDVTQMMTLLVELEVAGLLESSSFGYVRT